MSVTVKKVIQWINLRITKAAEDPNSVRRAARIKAYNILRDKILAKYSMNMVLTAARIDALDITDYMNSELKKITDKDINSDILTTLTAIHGVGSSKAKELASMGVKSINDLRRDDIWKKLPEETRAWLTYKPMERIPRKLIDGIKRKLANMLNPLTWEIAGSYRRGKPTSGDIDLVISYDGPMQYVINKLSPLKLIIYASGADNVAAIIKVRGGALKMDIRRCDPVEYPYYLLYLTGSKEHNIKMRSIAKKRGLVLNQRGLFRGKTRIAAKDEAAIFSILGMQYVSPENR